MPTSHRRIAIVEDGELRAALEAVAGGFAGVPKATIVHDLAVRGAGAWLAERRADERAVEELVRLSTCRDESLDWEVLESVDERAWGP